METIEEKFVFWCPLQKSENLIDPTTGEQIMRLGGIASTSDEDSDGEFLDPKGFDIKPLITSGMVNWHHQAKEHPDTIIGEPTKAEIRPEGLYLETDLYPSSKVACDVWELANTLEKDSKTRRLGYSIEGKVLKRKSNDKNSPDYKHIEKAVITGVAITHMPKNPKTFANIIKGDIDDDFSEEENTQEKEKAVDTENAAVLKKESVDHKLKVTTFAKADVLEKLFKDIPGISIKKAESIFLMLQKFANMKGKTQITEEDIQKAYEALGLNIESTDGIEKGCGAEEANDGEANEEPIAKADSKKKDDNDAGEEETTSTEEEETSEEETSEDDGTEEEEEVSESKTVRKAEGGNRFDRIEKAIATSHQINSKYIRALGVMIKDASQKLDAAAERENELRDIIKAQDETISMLSEKMEEYGNFTPAPKSLSHARPVERVFQKANDADITKADDTENSEFNNAISMSKQPAQVAELLDQATFAKGYDEEFSKACTAFEAVHMLPSNIIARMKSEFGVDIVK